MKYGILFFITIVVLFSCNCHHEGSGYVLDKNTGKPIVNARIEVHTGVPGKDTLSPAVFTDSNGYYSYSHDFCKDLISIQKENYTTFTVSKPNGDTSCLAVCIKK